MAQRLGADADQLAALRQEIERWRQARPKCRPMPAHLWEQAAHLARRLGVNPVRVRLGINYESLKERVGDTAARRETPRSAGFVEVSSAQLLAGTGPVVEVTDAQGQRLTIRLAAGSALDVAEVVQAFRRP